MTNEPPKPKGAMSVSDFANWASIGRTTAWKEIRDGHLRAVKVCARTIIRFEDAEVWLATRPQLAVPLRETGLPNRDLSKRFCECLAMSLFFITWL